MDEQTESIAARIRNFFHDLFGSRLVAHLETELFRQQSSYESRLTERDQTIADLRAEVAQLRAKFTEYELDPSYFWWLAERSRLPSRRDTNSSLDTALPPSTWAQIQAEHYRQQEQETDNGVPDGRRSESVREQIPGVSI